jgi:FkbM family methyltransferase
MNSPFDVFLEPEAQSINRARLAHLSSLGLDIDGKRVLEVGAGIGLRTEFFEARRCDVLSTDGAPTNVAEMMRRWPHRKFGVLDLDRPIDLRDLGRFEVVFCYGTLNHLRDPDGSLARLAAVCSGMILLETIVSRGEYAELNPVVEPPTANHAVSGIGCRPTRPWVMSALRRHFGHAYTTLNQPDYPDFVTDWSVVSHDGNLRAVFVGSRPALTLPTLSAALPVRHRNAPPRPRQAPVSRVRIDVGVDRADRSRAAAQADPGLAVHAFEPLPARFAKLDDNPPNYHVHAMAVGEHDGMAAFRINRLNATNSPLPIDEAARASWKGGELPGETTIEVPVTRLDSFMRQQGLRRVEFLRFFAQGGDLAALRSTGDRLADIDHVQLEVAVSPRPHDRDAVAKPAILDYMTVHGFRLTETQMRSHGQQENLIFVRAEPRITPHVARSAPADHDSANVGCPYDFAEAKTAHGQVRQIGDLLEVTTDPQPWAYAAVVPISTAFQDGETSSYEVELSVRVDQGVVQIGILNRAEDNFPSAAIVAESSTWQTVSLVTPPLNNAGPLVVRNAAGPGPGRARCRMVAAARLDPVESLQPSSAEAELLATQLQASAEVLGPMIVADPWLARAVAQRVVDAALLLRPSLACGGQGLIEMGIDSITSVFARLTDEQLAQLAPAIASLAPLRLMPGWRTDSFLESGELATFVRYAIWFALRRHEAASHVILSWHAGTRLDLDLRNDLGRAIFVAGRYEPNELALLDHTVKPGMIVLDGGASEGAYALFLGALVGEAGRVIAVEPSPRELQRLQANIALNRMAQVTVVRAALTDQAGEVELLVAERTHAGQNTLGGFVYPGVAAAGSVRTPATTIDTLIETQNLTALDVIKLDLEGTELRALAGAHETLRRWRPLLLFEAAQDSLAKQGGSLRGLLSLLVDCGYQVLSFDPSTGLPSRIGGLPLSDNLVAVHPERHWGLLSD